ncbi:MAG: hypothetical protein QM765_33950 [Myxococcales bacterium]
MARLLRRNAKGWTAEIDALLGTHCVAFRRGLIEHIDCVPERLEKLTAAAAMVPLRSLSIHDLPPGSQWAEQLAGQSVLAQIRTLHLSHHSPEALGQILGSPQLVRLEKVGLSGAVGQEDLDAFLNRQEALGMPRLEIGRVEDVVIQVPLPEAVTALWAALPESRWEVLAKLPRLESLHLRGGPTGPLPPLGLPALKTLELQRPTESCAQALRSADLRSLRTLRVRDVARDHSPLDTLAGLKDRLELERLEIDCWEVEAGPLVPLLAGPSLKHLSFCSKRLGRMAEAGCLRSLETLELRDCRLPVGDCRKLGANLGALWRLDVEGTKIEPPALEALLRANPHLEELRPHANDKSKGSTRLLALLSSGVLPKLRELSLRYVLDRPLLEFLRSPWAAGLESLRFMLAPECNRLPSQTWHAIADALLALPSLDELSMGYFTIDLEAKARLSQRFGRL